MTENKLLIIFPYDKSTFFLEKIIIYLHSKIHPSKFEVCKIEPNDESHKKAIKQITTATNTSIVFLGHGSFNSLQGANAENYSQQSFITAKNFAIFSAKKMLLVSCMSSTFIRRNRDTSFNEAIGFGDLPTDWSDIQAARESDVNAYKNITQDTIEGFSNSLVDIIKTSLVRYLNHNMNFKDLYHLIILQINKQISESSMKDYNTNLPVNDCLYQMKKEMEYFKNELS